MPAPADTAAPELTAEILAIGTELLLGEIIDTNTRAIARALRETGIDLFRTMTVGDNARRIAEALQDSFKRADVIITTGGLGPTIDDVTREGIAQAFGLELNYHSELWLQIEERFRRFHRTPTENNRRQAMLPEHARAIENPIGTAPGFILTQNEKTVIALPGVPAEMVCLLEQSVIPFLKQRSPSETIILPRVLHLAGVGESWVDERIQDLETSPNPTVGLAAHPGQVDIRITAKASSPEEAQRMLDEMERTLRDRLGDAVYGTDETKLEEILLASLKESGTKVSILEQGAPPDLLSLFDEHPDVFILVEEVKGRQTNQAIRRLLRESLSHHPGVNAGAILFSRETTRFELRILLQTQQELLSHTRHYGGPESTAPRWAYATTLNFLRQAMLSHSE